MKMFQKIQELVDDKDSLVCILIDEVSVMTKFCSVSHNNYTSLPPDVLPVWISLSISTYKLSDVGSVGESGSRV